MSKKLVCNFITRSIEKQAERLNLDKTRVAIAHNLLAEKNPNNIEPEDSEVEAYIKAADERVRLAYRNIEENKRNHTKNIVSPIVSLAPYRTYAPVTTKGNLNLSDAVAIRNRQIELEKMAKTYEDAARLVASSLGLEVESFVETRGSWENNLEPSYAVTFDKKTADDKSEEILLFTALMADLGNEVQKSALVTKYLPEADASANGVELSLRFNFTKEQTIDEVARPAGAQSIVSRLRDLMQKEGLGDAGFTIDWERGEIRFLVSPDSLSDTEFRELLGKYNNLLEGVKNTIISKNGKAETQSTAASITELNSAARGSLYKSWLDEQGKNHDKLSSDTRELIEHAQRKAEEFRAIEAAEEIQRDFYRQANPQKPLTEDELNGLQTQIVQRLDAIASGFDNRYIYRIEFHKDGKGKQDIFIYTEKNLTASDTTSTALARLHGTYTPERLDIRVDMLARKMSTVLAGLVDSTHDSLSKLLDELKATREAEYKKPAEEQNKATINELNRRIGITKKGIAALDRWNSGMPSAKADAINVIGLHRIETALLQDLTRLKNSPERSDYEVREYGLILDNYSAMKAMVRHRFAYLEGITIARQAEENSDDDETGAYATGNDGWSQSAHTSDSFLGMSELVRSCLKNCVLRENNPVIKKGKKVFAPIKDDLGYKMYIDPKTAYQEIAQHLSTMLDDSDFFKDGKYVGLEHMAELKGYAWVRDVINYLKKNPDSAPLFYNAFRMDMTQFWHYEGGGFKPINSLPAGDAFLQDVKRAVRYAEKYSDTSIWEKGAITDNIGTISKVQDMVTDAQHLLDSKKFEGTDEQVAEIAGLIGEAVRSLGANIEDERVEELIKIRLDAKSKSRLNDLLSQISNILAAAKKSVEDKSKNEKKQDGTLADNIFSSTYNNFRELGGELEYFNGTSYVASFRDCGATYYALEKPNFVTTAIKAMKLSDDKRRQEYMDRVYKSNFFMYDSLYGWKSSFLEEIYNPDNENLRQMLDICTFNSYSGNKFPDMSADEILKSEVGMFFAPMGLNDGDVTSAWYHVSNYSNAQSTDFIRYKRERGKNYKDVLRKKIVLGVKQELMRIRLGQERNAKLKEAKPDTVNGNLEGINRWDKNSTHFCMYPFFENWTDSKTKLNLHAALAKYVEDKDKVFFDSIIERGVDAMLNSDTTDYLKVAPIEEFIHGYLREYASNADGKELSELSKKLYSLKRGDLEVALFPTKETADSISPEAKKLAGLIENYVWNTNYMLSQIIEFTTGDLAFYKTGDRGVDFVKRYKEVTATGDALFTKSRYGKPYSVVIGVRDHSQTSLDFSYIRASLEEAVLDGRLKTQKGREMAEFMLEQYKNMNITDGQSFRTLPSLRSVMDMLGKWDDNLQAAYERIMQGKYAEEDLYTVFVALKPFIFSLVSTQTGVDGSEIGLEGEGPISIGVPTQYKDSEAVLMTLAGKLSGAFEKSDKARGLEKFMRNYGIDIAKFESTTKVGLQGAVDLRYSPSFNEKDEKRWNNILKAYKDKFNAAEKKAKETETTNEMIPPSRMSYNDYMDFARETYIQSLSDKKITQETFNSIMAEMEPSEEEVYDILEKSIIRPMTIDNYMQYVPSGENPLPEGISWVTNPNPYQEWEKDGMSDTELAEYSLTRPTVQYNPQRVKFVDNRDYRIVQPTREHLFDSKVVLGVQVKNLATADLPENFSMTIRGKRFDAKETRKLWHELLVENLLDDYVKLAETFESAESLSQALQSAIEGNPKYDDDILQAIQVEKVKDPVTGVISTRFHTPMSDPANSVKLAEIVLSLFKNRIAKQTIFGGAAVIETGWSFSKDLHARRDENGNLLGYECYLPAWSRLYFQKYLNQDGSFDYDRMSKEHPELMRMVGYRIPTDHKHSMVPLIVKGFLPTQKANQIIIAEEAVVAAGEDKDIDKKYLIMPAFSIPLDKKKFKRDFITQYKKKGGYITKLDSGKIDDAIDKLLDSVVDNLADGVIEASQNTLEKEVFDFYLDNADIYGSPDIQKIEYDVNKSPKEQTKTTRNNMLFDMLYNILINKSVSDQTQLPTNFVNCKRGGFISNVAKYMARTNDTSVTAAQLLSMDYDELEKRSDDADASETYNPFSPLNFARHHKANMDALKLVGAFASTLTVNAKYQGTDSSLDPDHFFTINGKQVTSMVEPRDIYGLLSSFNFSESINASTDNGKDPSIARLGITLDNASIVSAMLATGASINTVSFFLNQPLLSLGRSAYEKVNKIVFDARKRKSNADILRDGITEEELLQNILDGGRLENILLRYDESLNATAVDSLMDPGAANFSLDPDEEQILINALRASVFYQNYEDISQVFLRRTGISRADGTNGGADRAIGGVMYQQRKLGYFAKYVRGRTKMGKDGPVPDPVINVNTLDVTYPKNLRELLKGNLTQEKIDKLREAFLASGLPAVQAAHTLGIEATQILMGEYFSEYSERSMEVYNEIMDNSAIPSGGTTETGPDYATTILGGLRTFALAGTDLFGDDGVRTMAKKRDYYVYEYPKEYFKVLKENPEIKDLYYFKNINWSGGKLRLDGASKLTRERRLQVKADIDNVFLGRILPSGLSEVEKNNKRAVYNKLIRDILMYSFYTGQLTYGATTIGNFLSDDIKHAFPEYIEALDHISDAVATESQKELFMDQLFAQGLIGAKSLPYDKDKYTMNEDGSVDIPVYLATNDYLTLDGVSQPIRYLSWNEMKEIPTEDGGTRIEYTYHIYKLFSSDGKTAHYVPMNKLEVKDGTKFNPNSTYEEDQQIRFNAARYERLGDNFKKQSLEEMLLNSMAADFEALDGVNIDSLYDESWEAIDAVVAGEEKSGPSTENSKTPQTGSTVGITKVISGGQTGVDTIGLKVGRKLGIETGGTAPKGFLRESGIDDEDISSYGLREITDAEQADYTKRKGKTDSYTARTELNVRNSDGTVYFSTDSDSAGLIATRRAAEEFDKPFILNPSTSQLVQWMIDNNISTLNVAGNRGSKLPKDNKVAQIVENAIRKYNAAQQAASQSTSAVESNPEYQSDMDTTADTLATNFDIDENIASAIDTMEALAESGDLDAAIAYIENPTEPQYPEATDKLGNPCKKK